jgi:hypothetical protein
MNVLENAKHNFYNPNLKKIVNVYQLNYKGGAKPPGFGDYLKSCFFLLHLCKALDLDFDMNFKNHPISKYLIVDKQENIDFSNVEYPYWAEHIFIENSGLDLFIKNLNTVSSQNYYLFTNGWPIVKIRQKGVDIIRSKLVPNDFLIQHVRIFMSSLSLRPKQFITIHIRCSDDIFNNVSNASKLQKFKNAVANISSTYNCPCLILSNSNRAKYFIKKLRFPNLCFKVSNVVHLGSGEASPNVTNFDDGILDTLKDFFVMSRSKLIVSMSVYDWGSCFSDMCSQLYSVPIIKIKI